MAPTTTKPPQGGGTKDFQGPVGLRESGTAFVEEHFIFDHKARDLFRSFALSACGEGGAPGSGKDWLRGTQDRLRLSLSGDFSAKSCEGHLGMIDVERLLAEAGLGKKPKLRSKPLHLRPGTALLNRFELKARLYSALLAQGHRVRGEVSHRFGVVDIVIFGDRDEPLACAFVQPPPGLADRFKGMEIPIRVVRDLREMKVFTDLACGLLDGADKARLS